MAVRARVFDAGHRFEEQIGPMAGISYAMGSETEFTLRMEQLGHSAWFVPRAVVEHIVRGFQMNRSWVLARAVRFGRGMFRRDRQCGEPRPSLFLGMPRWQLRRMVTHALSLAGAKLTGDAHRAFQHAWALHVDWGYVDEARRWSNRGLPW